jgi:hypothetical protein
MLVVNAAALTSGTIAGRITDATAHLPLAGTTVVVDNGATGTTSDHDGHFRLADIAPGSHAVTVSFIGYRSTSATAAVEAGSTTRVDFNLQPGLVTLDEVVVVGERLQGQARPINQQKAELNITNIVAADQIGRFPDTNIGDALSRLPGIAVEYDQGEVRYGLVRGTEARMNSFTLNGERVPSAEGDIRAVQLDLIPSDMIQAIEVN